MSCSVALHTAVPLGIDGSRNPRKIPSARSMSEVSCKHALVGTERCINFLVLIDSDDFRRRYSVPKDRASSTLSTTNYNKINILLGNSVAPIPLEEGCGGRASALTAGTMPSQMAKSPPSRFCQYEGGIGGIEDAAAIRSHFRYMHEKPAQALRVSRVFPASPGRLGELRSGALENRLLPTGTMVMGS